jgi:hypothetical protein
MPNSRRNAEHPDESTARDTGARPPQGPSKEDEASTVRQDEGLTNAERLPRRGDQELPPGNDSSI